VLTRRTYSDGCAVSHAMELVGDRWALLVVRELLLGPKRFTELRRGLPGVAANVATQRLRELVAAGVVRHHTLPPPVGSKVYELTEWGHELEPVVRSLATWAARSPGMRRGDPLSVDSMMLALRTLYVPGMFAGVAGLRIGLDEFVATVGAECVVTRGHAPAPDFALATDAGTFRDVVWGGRPLADAIGEGAVTCVGDVSAAVAFLGSFPQPA
jgi:DNA-binding HxlR family transcriptional regulator